MIGGLLVLLHAGHIRKAAEALQAAMLGFRRLTPGYYGLSHRTSRHTIFPEVAKQVLHRRAITDGDSTLAPKEIYERSPALQRAASTCNQVMYLA